MKYFRKLLNWLFLSIENAMYRIKAVSMSLEHFWANYLEQMWHSEDALAFTFQKSIKNKKVFTLDMDDVYFNFTNIIQN